MTNDEKIKILEEVLENTLRMLYGLANDAENMAGISLYNLKVDIEKEINKLGSVA